MTATDTLILADHPEGLACWSDPDHYCPRCVPAALASIAAIS